MAAWSRGPPLVSRGPETLTIAILHHWVKVAPIFGTLFLVATLGRMWQRHCLASDDESELLLHELPHPHPRQLGREVARAEQRVADRSEESGLGVVRE